MEILDIKENEEKDDFKSKQTIEGIKVPENGIETQNNSEIEKIICNTGEVHSQVNYPKKKFKQKKI